MTYSFHPQPPQVGCPGQELALEHSLRELAKGLTAEQWQTGAYHDLQLAVALGDWHEFVVAMLAQLEAASAQYGDLWVCPHELTMESLVGHRLLLEGVDAWHEALASLDEHTGAALKWAEFGNRLLVSVQLFSRRLNLQK